MRRSPFPLVLLASLLLAACGEVVPPTQPSDGPSLRADASQLPATAQQRAQWFHAASPEVMALAEAVFAVSDEATGQLVFGIDRPGAAPRVRAILAREGVPASAYRIEVTEPIRFMNTSLRTAHRPVVGGIQIHWSNYLCTLGFNADHADGRSFVTNSHCTTQQGALDNTAYYQPLSSLDPTIIAFEADDPPYKRGGGCSRGKVCRDSDAARAAYQAGTTSTRGSIAKTTGVNSESVVTNGSFTITAQENSATTFNGVVHKVGRTTGWTSGFVVQTCATVNVFGSNVQLRCQTLVSSFGGVIVGGGDSGSPVFSPPVSDNVTLLGILWGGSGSGDMFVFSPLKGVQDELGALDATVDGTGGGGGGGGEDPPCEPRGNSGKCK